MGVVESKLVFPYHKGNGLDNSDFSIFTTKSYNSGDRIITQNVELLVRTVVIDMEDFMEEYYQLIVVVVTNMQPGAFMMFDYNDLRIWNTYLNGTMMNIKQPSRVFNIFPSI